MTRTQGTWNLSYVTWLFDKKSLPNLVYKMNIQKITVYKIIGETSLSPTLFT